MCPASGQRDAAELMIARITINMQIIVGVRQVSAPYIIQYESNEIYNLIYKKYIPTLTYVFMVYTSSYTDLFGNEIMLMEAHYKTTKY